MKDHALEMQEFYVHGPVDVPVIGPPWDSRMTWAVRWALLHAVWACGHKPGVTGTCALFFVELIVFNGDRLDMFFSYAKNISVLRK